MVANYGASILPESLKQSSEDMYWLNELSHYHDAKVTLRKYKSGELDASGLTPDRLRELLLVTGTDKKEAEKQAAKFHLELVRSKRQ